MIGALAHLGFARSPINFGVMFLKPGKTQDDILFAQTGHCESRMFQMFMISYYCFPNLWNATVRATYVQRTTNLAKDIWRENSKDSWARGLLLYTILHEAETYNGPVGTRQTMGTHCGAQAWGSWGSWVSPTRCEEVLKCSKWVCKLQKCIMGFEGVLQTSEAYHRVWRHIVECPFTATSFVWW